MPKSNLKDDLKCSYIENIEEKLLHDVSSGGPIQRAFWNNVGKITSKSMFDNETVDNYFNNLAKIMSGGGCYDI